ncbi:MAG: propanediol utilization protein [Pelagimonas sp.]|uniref:GHMP family kinase ATP-binding protein n=1 Tax=Pelagimonas sp. TaxID=2073170 RepID=UPI003D6A540C
MLLRTSVAGHFGELMQGRLGQHGPVVLVTLPCPALCVHARAVPSLRTEIYSPQRILSAQRARRFRHGIQAPTQQRITLHSDMPPGGGAGASTAALVALAQLSGRRIDPADLAKACLKIEGATDPLMFPQPEQMLWASRQARVISPLPVLPKIEVIGGFFGPLCTTMPGDENFADISDLVPQWTQATHDQDLKTIAQLTTTSALRNLKQRGIANDPTIEMARNLNALGVVMAHTGAARGLIFAPNSVPLRARATLKSAGFSRLVQFKAGGNG